jgi:hypothetical protein
MGSLVYDEVKIQQCKNKVTVSRRSKCLTGMFLHKWEDMWEDMWAGKLDSRQVLQGKLRGLRQDTLEGRLVDKWARKWEGK